MSSETDVPDENVTEEVPEVREPVPPAKKALRLFVLIAVSALVLYLIGHFGHLEGLEGFAREYWPVFMAPLAGWFLGKKVALSLYHPQGRYVVMLRPDLHLMRIVFIPEAAFRMMTQTGNNVCYHTPGGAPLYVAKDMDLYEGEISYGWVHELDAMQVMTRENAYVKWDATLNEVLEENLELMSHPHIIGLGYARKGLRSHLDAMAEILGFTEADYDPHRTVRDEPDDEEKKDEEAEE